MRRILTAAVVAASCFLCFAGDAKAGERRAACICADSCACSPDKCPGGCPVLLVSAAPVVGLADPCPGGKCPTGSRPAAGIAAPASVPASVSRDGWYPGKLLKGAVQHRPRLIRGRGCSSCGG